MIIINLKYLNNWLFWTACTELFWNNLLRLVFIFVEQLLFCCLSDLIAWCVQNCNFKNGIGMKQIIAFKDFEIHWRNATLQWVYAQGSQKSVNFFKVCILILPEIRNCKITQITQTAIRAPIFVLLYNFQVFASHYWRLA